MLLLIAIALIGLAAAAAVQIGATMARREAERELLAIGAEFERALRSYAGVAQGPGSVRVGARGPRTLGELLRDPRVPGVRRHLRQIYADPLTGSTDWGTIRDPEGYILAIYSNAPGHPITTVPDEKSGDAHGLRSYSDWQFGLLGLSAKGKPPFLH